MPKTFSLDQFASDSLTFKDLDGKEYKVRTTEDFGPADVSRVNSLQDRYKKAIQDAQHQNDKVRERAGQMMEQVLDEMIALVVPTLPMERIRAMKIAYKVKFSTWWQEQMQERNTPQP